MHRSSSPAGSGYDRGERELPRYENGFLSRMAANAPAATFPERSPGTPSMDADF
jgi:hypothetical protein